jgi:hypothetical protein
LASLSRPAGSLADELAPAVIGFDRSGLTEDSSVSEKTAVTAAVACGKRDFGPRERVFHGMA